MAEESKSKVFDQANGFLQVAAQVGIATVAMHLTFAKSLPEQGNIILPISGICTAAGFLASLSANVLGKTGRVARLLIGTAGAATACGFISMLGLFLPAHLMLWIPLGICVIVIFAFGFAFAKDIFPSPSLPK